MTRRAALRVSHPAMETWRPDGDRLSYGDVAWTGASVGVALHAIISFFSVPMPRFEVLLVVFLPAERLALVGLASAAPLARWMALLVSQGVFWALASVALLGLWREAVAVVGTVRPRRTGRSAA